MLCCDNSTGNMNQTCTLEYYQKNTDLFPNFNYMTNARPMVLVLTVINVYLLLVTALHGLHKRHPDNISWAIRTLPLSLFTCLLFAARSLVDLYPFHIAGCDAIHWLGGILYGLGGSHVYTILWSRQRMLYADPLLKHTVKKRARTLSIVTIIAIYVLFWSLCILFQFLYCLESSPVGCIVIWNVGLSNSFTLGVIGVFVFTSNIFHALLLGLIAYPLMRDEERWSVCKMCRKLRSPAKNDVEKMLKRLFFCASVCVVASQIMGVTMVLDVLNVIRMYCTLPIQVDLLVSNISVICAFSDWQQRIFPFTRWRRSSGEKHKI